MTRPTGAMAGRSTGRLAKRLRVASARSAPLKVQAVCAHPRSSAWGARRTRPRATRDPAFSALPVRRKKRACKYIQQAFTPREGWLTKPRARACLGSTVPTAHRCRRAWSAQLATTAAVEAQMQSCAAVPLAGSVHRGVPRLRV